MSQRVSRKKPTTIPLSGHYRLEFIRPKSPSRFIEAATPEAVEKKVREYEKRKEYITCNVYQFGRPVQIFPRLANGKWFAAVRGGPFTHLATLAGGS